MNAILGQIESIVCDSQETANHGAGQYRVELKFRPRCVMPERKQVPEWLKDQVLSVCRVVSDLREIGYPGDSVVLTPSESSKWLSPLTVTPSLVFESPRGQVRICLNWWKDEKPPEAELKANGRVSKVKLDKAGESWVAVSPWVRLRVTADTAGAGITSLIESGRNVDHFDAPKDFVQRRFERSGHADLLVFGWSDNRLAKTEMSPCSARREGGATRMSFVGAVDKKKGLRTTVSYLVDNELPLVTIQRELFFCSDSQDTKKEDRKPSEMIDDVASVSMQFRAAWRADNNGRSGSRVLALEDGHLRSIRCVQPNELVRYNTFRMFDGWAIVEHPGRRECTMYLFDGASGPQMGTRLGSGTITLEPTWMPVPVHPKGGCGYTIGLVVGEVCGGSNNGGWVVCRTKSPTEGVTCAMVARVKCNSSPVAEFTLGSSVVKTPLERSIITGLGEIAYAVAHFPEGSMSEPIRAAVPGIPGRCSQ